MLQETIEPQWLAASDAVLGRCAVQKGDTVAVLGESQSRPMVGAGPPGCGPPWRPRVFRAAAQQLQPGPAGDAQHRRLHRAAPAGAGDFGPGRQHAGGRLHRRFNGSQLRALAGNFLYGTGANEVAGRHTAGHLDLPMRQCTVTLDGTTVVDAGRLVP
jgi:hypothetical protein